jgi:hypothetical protein
MEVTASEISAAEYMDFIVALLMTAIAALFQTRPPPVTIPVSEPACGRCGLGTSRIEARASLRIRPAPAQIWYALELSRH